MHTNPEFLREGSALYDFDNPPFVVIGSAATRDGVLLEQLYEGTGPTFHTSIKTAETLKYVCNTFHALKITFANEIGNICQALGVDSYEVMDLFCRDTKLNISPAYLGLALLLAVLACQRIFAHCSTKPKPLMFKHRC